MQIRTAHLFAGAGGGLLASEILGHRNTLAVENNPRRCEVLRQSSIEGWFPGLHVHQGDIRKWDPAPWRGRVDCIAAGFPCEDISCAGRGAGIKGKRSGLVFEIFRAVDIIRPRFIFLENSPAIRKQGRGTIIRELLERGYAWRDGTLKASDVGAGHIRKRWWLLAADPHGQRQQQQEGHHAQGRRRPGDRPQEPQDPPDALRFGLEIAVQQSGLYPAEAEAIDAAARHTQTYHWAPPHIGLCRVVDELADRIHRIEALGLGQVPLQAAAAWKILEEPAQ